MKRIACEQREEGSSKDGGTPHCDDFFKWKRQ